MVILYLRGPEEEDDQKEDMTGGGGGPKEGRAMALG